MDEEKEICQVLHKNTVAGGNWRSKVKTINQRFKFLLEKGILSDITLLVGQDNVPIQSHKLMLASVSPLFESLLKRPEVDFVQISEITPSACQKFLKFIYTDELELGPLDDDEELISLAKAGKKFEVANLFDKCIECLRARLSERNAFYLLQKGKELESEILEIEALRFACGNAKDLINSEEDFLKLNYEALYAFISQDSLQLDELTIFRLTLKWAEAECIRNDLIPDSHKNLRKVLQNAIYEIRFGCMTSEIFSLYVKGTNILSHEELVNIYTYISLKQSGQYKLLELTKVLKFNCKERTYNRSRKFAVSRFPRLGTELTSWSYKGDFDRISFQTNRPIVMLGFSIYGSREEARASYFIKYFLHELTSGKGDYLASNLITSKELIVKQMRSNENIYILFQEPGINVKEGVWYTISALIQGSISHYGEDGREKIELSCGPSEKVVFKFRGVKNSSNGTFVQIGQFPEILFRLP